MDANQNTEISLEPSQTSQNQPRPFLSENRQKNQ